MFFEPLLRLIVPAFGRQLVEATGFGGVFFHAFACFVAFGEVEAAPAEPSSTRCLRKSTTRWSAPTSAFWFRWFCPAAMADTWASRAFWALATAAGSICGAIGAKAAAFLDWVAAAPPVALSSEPRMRPTVAWRASDGSWAAMAKAVAIRQRRRVLMDLVGFSSPVRAVWEAVIWTSARPMSSGWGVRLREVVSGASHGGSGSEVPPRTGKVGDFGSSNSGSAGSDPLGALRPRFCLLDFWIPAPVCCLLRP